LSASVRSTLHRKPIIFKRGIHASRSGGQDVRAPLLPRSSDGMRLSIEDDLIEIECPGRREQEIEVFEGFRKDEALH